MIKVVYVCPNDGSLREITENTDDRMGVNVSDIPVACLLCASIMQRKKIEPSPHAPGSREVQNF